MRDPLVDFSFALKVITLNQHSVAKIVGLACLWVRDELLSRLLIVIIGIGRATLLH